MMGEVVAIALTHAGRVVAVGFFKSRPTGFVAAIAVTVPGWRRALSPVPPT